MNKLSTDKKIIAVKSLVEGSSIRSIERMTGIHRDTIMRLGVRVGDTCAKLMDEKMRNLNCTKVQIDEIWGFVGKKQRNVTDEDNRAEVGDAWTFVAIDAETRLVPSFRVGKRDSQSTQLFIEDLASRLKNRVQLSSDSMHAYLNAIESTFGTEVDYGQIVKTFATEGYNKAERKYSPDRLVSVDKSALKGRPDAKHISTSYVERQNLTMRMHCRRLTRLTNAFSKKMDNFKSAVALHFGYYNFVRVHKTLRMTPAMYAGVESKLLTVGDLVEMSE